MVGVQHTERGTKGLEGLNFGILPGLWDMLGEGSEQEFHASYLPRALEAHRLLVARSCPGSDFLGWLDLPARMQGGEQEAICQLADQLALEWEAVVVVGIGGSYLGAKALQEALVDAWSDRNRPDVYYLGHTLCSSTFRRVCRQLQGRRWGVVVISKSGTTLEPGVIFRMLRAEMNRTEPGYQPSRVVVVTDPAHGALRAMAAQEGFRSFVLPGDVGGRYSVFSPVGLLPLAIVGVDIRALLQGAYYAQQNLLLSGVSADNQAVHYAALRQMLSDRGYILEVLAYYTPLLHYVGEWWKQLFGESEGKQGGGIMPLSLCYSTDLHSLGQYVQDGRRMLFETHLEILSPLVEKSPEVLEDAQDLDGLNYLAGKRLDEINRAVCQATQQAHVKGWVPSLRIALERLDAYHLGMLLYFLEMSCAVSALVQGVNPFDQPGVEAYKQSMFTLLGRPGFGR